MERVVLPAGVAGAFPWIYTEEGGGFLAMVADICNLPDTDIETKRQMLANVIATYEVESKVKESIKPATKAEIEAVREHYQI